MCDAFNKTISLVRPISELEKPAVSSPAERDLWNTPGAAPVPGYRSGPSFAPDGRQV